MSVEMFKNRGLGADSVMHCVAPMMDWTDEALSLFSPAVIAKGIIVHRNGNS